VSDLITPTAEQHSIMKFPVKEKVEPGEIFCRLNALYEEVKVSMTGIVCFLKAVKKSGAYCMLTFCQQLYMRGTFCVNKLILGNR
jgi:hypothetical protein